MKKVFQVSDEGVKALLAEEAAEGGHFIGRAVEGRHRLARFAVADQFDDAEQSDGAHRAHRRMFGLHLRSQLFEDGAHFFRVVDQAIFFIHTNGRQRRRAGIGMAVVGEPAVENLILKVLGDGGPHPDRAQGQVARGQALGHANEVGTTPQWSTANHSPVRPKPDMTSSAIIRMP